MKSKAKNLAFGILIFLGTLFVLEILLRFYGADLRISMSDLSRRRYVRAHHNYFADLARKSNVSEGTFNIYFLGESTMWGVPFGPHMSVPGLVDYRLGDTLRGRSVRSVNFSSAAKDAVYARYVAELILREKEIFHPSLIVVYSGHNQFLKFHPTDPDLFLPGAGWLADHSELARQLLILISRSTGQILELDRRRFIDRSAFPFDQKGYDKVIQSYKQQISKLVRASQANGVPVIISTLVSNYVDWEPNRSVFCDSPEARAQKQRFEELFYHGLESEKQKNYDSALKAYQEASSICDRFAEVYFRQGRIYKALGQYDQAWDAFQNAKDYDAFPTYAVSAQNDFIKSLAHLDHVFVADSLAHLRKHSKDSLLDEDLIIDGMHPNLEGYLLLSEAIAEKIYSLFASAEEHLKPLDTETAKKVFRLDEAKMFEVNYETGRWVSRLATWHYDPEHRLKIAEHFFKKAIEINPKSYEGHLGLAVVAFIRTNAQQAEEFLKEAQSFDLERTNRYVHNPWIRKVMRRANHLYGQVLGLP